MLHRRFFLFGSEWVYIKLYVDYISSNQILVRIINPLLKKIELFGVDKFFFIRYEDPEPHLRLRFHFSNVSAENIYKLIEYLNIKYGPLIKAGIIHKVQNDVYNREIERYTNALIQDVETLFCEDSKNIIRFLSHSPNSIEKLCFAIKIADQYLSCWFKEYSQRKIIVSELSESFMKEFGIYNNSAYTSQINKKYRDFRAKIIQSLIDSNSFTKSTIQILDERFSFIGKFKKKVSINKINKKKSKDLLLDIMHMSFNRLFFSDNRFNEFVVYYFLYKSYDSLIQLKQYEK